MLQPNTSPFLSLFLSCFLRKPGDAAGSDSLGVSLIETTRPVYLSIFLFCPAGRTFPLEVVLV